MVMVMEDLYICAFFFRTNAMNISIYIVLKELFEMVVDTGLIEYGLSLFEVYSTHVVKFAFEGVS